MSAATMGLTEAEYFTWRVGLRGDYQRLNRRMGRSLHTALCYGIVDSDEAATPEAIAALEATE
jgi:hypothetical protein